VKATDSAVFRMDERSEEGINGMVAGERSSMERHMSRPE
jgi:hypothetical protein